MYQLTNGNNNIKRTSDGASIPKDPANTDYAEYLKWVALGNTPEPYVAPPAQIPQVIPRSHGKAALINAGLWDGVVTHVAAITDKKQQALVNVVLNDTTNWHRDSTYLSNIGLTSAQLDSIFTAAESIVL